MVEILEQGAISFLAEPRRGTVDPAGPQELSPAFLVLAPAGRRPLRRLSIRRRLSANGGERLHARVDRIARAAALLTDDVRRPPSGGRGRLGVRVLAMGRYAIARHGDHVHLAYALARACAHGPLAARLGIGRGDSFVLCVPRSRDPRRPEAGEPLAPAASQRLDVLGAEIALLAGRREERPAALGIPGAAADRVGEALVGALLRRGPRPRIASIARVREASAAVRGAPAGRAVRAP